MTSGRAEIPEVRYYRFVDRTNKDGCWLWTGTCSPEGYGRFQLRTGKPVQAHRFGWELSHGPISPNHFICHSCDNPPCVRPDHLFVGTPKDNTRDMVNKNRAQYVSHPGEANGRAVLALGEVEQIRRRYAAGERQRPLAKEYGVAQSTISQIANGRLWKESAHGG